MVKLKRFLIIFPWILLIGLSLLYIYKKDVLQTYLGDPNQPLYDSIDVLQKERLQIKEEIEKLNASYDSLLHQDKTVIIKHHDKIKFIHSASPTELDSLILSGIKTKFRYDTLLRFN